MHALFLTTVLPGNMRSGGEVVSQLFIDAIRNSGWTVTVVGYQRPGDPPVEDRGAIVVEERAIETSAGPLSGACWFVTAYLGGRPYTASKFLSGKYRRVAQEVGARERPDVIVIDHAQLAWVLADVNSTIPIVAIAHNIEAELYRKLADEARWLPLRLIYRREARLIGRFEQQLARRARQVWTLSNHDATHFRGRSFAVPARPNAEPRAVRRPLFDVALLGSWTWKANAAGLRWFVRKVLPHVPRELSIRIAGKGAEWLEPHERVDVVGVVADAGEFLQSARVIAVPSLFGGGVQIKTLDAIATGRPVVASSAAMRGIDAVPASVHATADHLSFAAELTRLAAAEPDERMRAEAIAWSHGRARRFGADVTAALAEVAPQADAEAQAGRRGSP